MNDYERKALREHAEHHYGEEHHTLGRLVLKAVGIFAVIYVLMYLAMSM